MSAPALSTPVAPSGMAAPILLTMTEVTRIHGTGPAAVTALDRVSMHVRAGELVAVMGASGSGKSTLLNLAGGLDTRTDGDVALDENLLSRMKPDERAKMRRRHVGHVFQDLNLIPAAYDAWAADCKAGKQSILLAADGQTVSTLHARARLARQEAGVVETGDVPLADGTEAGQGNHVITCRNDRRLAIGYSWVKNGDRWQVLARQDDGALTIRRADGNQIGTITLPARYPPSMSTSATPSPCTAPKDAPSKARMSSSRPRSPGRACMSR